MLIAVPMVAVGLFAAVFLRRWKMDLEQEKAFRAQLTGIDLDRTRIPLS